MTFPAELLLILGALTTHHSLGFSALAGAVLSAAYMLSFTRKAFFGSVTQANVNTLQDLRPREMALLCIPALLVLALGFSPNSLLKINLMAAEAWLTHLMEQPIIEPNEVVQLSMPNKL